MVDDRNKFAFCLQLLHYRGGGMINKLLKLGEEMVLKVAGPVRRYFEYSSDHQNDSYHMGENDL